jgi:hypothetical protein
MSKNINVNPDHYKVAGRERQGEDILHEDAREELARAEKRRGRQAPRIPNQEHSSPPAARRRTPKTK